MEGSGASAPPGDLVATGARSPARPVADRGDARGRGLHASGRGWVDADRVARNRRNRRLRRTAAVVAALVVLLAWVGIAGGPGATPVAAVRVTLPAAHQVPAGDPAMPWPPTGESAVAVPAVGYRAQSGPEHPVPVASMTKVMTAYVVLHDHPLATGSNGPDLNISPADAQDFTTDLDTTQASVEIQAGEVLTERQALDGMLVHSANDLAYTLACWDAGSVPAFVAKMNATAATLGMHQTHYADASGYTPHSMSTAADLLKVTSAAMAYPAFAQAVSMPSVTLPVSGTSLSYTPLLAGGTASTPGVVGVKSGFTSAAGGGDILAYRTTVAGRPLVALAAVTSQQGPEVLDTAGHMALAIAQSAAGAVVAVPVVGRGQAVARASVPGATVPVVTNGAATVLAMPGQRITQTVIVAHHPRAGSRAGATVGTALFTLGDQQQVVAVRTAARLGNR
ncbi:MAG: D-alanyl-D-alanine carboxypeptidase family protein [Acidimicrobiales bacterium]